MAFSKYLNFSLIKISRSFHISSLNPFKVAILGANGGIGQPLSLLLKKAEPIGELALYDVVPVKGLVADLSHIPKHPRVVGYEPTSAGLVECLRGSDITIIVAGQPRRPGMTRADLLSTNASIVAPLISQCALVAPKTMICIVTNPINSLVPMAARILKSSSAYDPRRLFGVTTLDSVRANTFVAEAKGLTGTKVYVPVVGGHSESTLIPAISQCVPPLSFPPAERANLTKRIQTGGSEVLEAKAGMGSATLSMAYATLRFVCSLMEGMKGKEGVVECAFVESPEGPCDFFATPLVLGPSGVERSMGIGNLIESELKQLKSAIPELEENIRAGSAVADEYLRLMKSH